MTNIPTNKDPQTILAETIGDEPISRSLVLKAMDAYGKQCYQNRSSISYTKYKKSLGENAVCVCEYPSIKMFETPLCLKCGRKVEEDWFAPYKNQSI